MAGQNTEAVQSTIGAARLSQSVCAVKALIPRAANEVLLVRRSSYAGAANPLSYGPPGGAVEPGETLIEALQREVAEETSLSVSITGIAGIREWSALHKNAHYICVFFACEPIDRHATVALNHENCEFLWARPRQLKSLQLSDSSRGIVEQFLGGRELPVIPYQMPFRFPVARRHER